MSTVPVQRQVYSLDRPILLLCIVIPIHGLTVLSLQAPTTDLLVLCITGLLPGRSPCPQTGSQRRSCYGWCGPSSSSSISGWSARPRPAARGTERCYRSVSPPSRSLYRSFRHVCRLKVWRAERGRWGWPVYSAAADEKQSRRKKRISHHHGHHTITTS